MEWSVDLIGDPRRVVSSRCLHTAKNGDDVAGVVKMLKTPSREFVVAAFVFSTAIWSTVASASDWQVRRSNSSGTCSLQPSDSQPPLGKLLATKPTKKEACEAAKSLKTEDATDTDKCFDYTPNTVNLCRPEGVDLPK